MKSLENNNTARLEVEILKLKPASIFDIIDKSFFFELGTHHDEYLKCGNYYEIYYAIAKYYAPKSILEIGVRYGYSLASMISGAASSIKRVVGYDIDQYEKNSISIAEENVKKYLSGIDIEYSFELKNSQNITSLNGQYDVTHIDGDHSYYGKLHDLNLALRHSKIIIVDDYTHLEDVRRAVVDWTSANKDYIKNTYLIDSIRGTFIIEIDMERLPENFSSSIVIDGIHCLPGDTDITSYVRHTGTLKWDKPFDFISKFIGSGSNRTMIDVGAYIGDSTKWFVDEGWVCHAFEPQKDAFECLSKNLAGTKTIFYNEALGSGQSFSLDKIDVGNLGGRSLNLGGSLKSKRLDEVVESADFIKIDAEGFEPYVLSGATALLKQRPIVAIEVNIPGLNKYGFWPHDILKHFEDYDAIETYNWQGYQYDLLLIPKEKTVGLIETYVATYKKPVPQILDISKPVYVVLGRFGDIYMVGKKLKQPSIICCSTRFSQMAKEMLPEHEIFELHPRYAENPIAAGRICELKFPSKRVIVCQQDGQDRSLMNDFKSFQSFQEHYAQF